MGSAAPSWINVGLNAAGLFVIGISAYFAIRAGFETIDVRLKAVQAILEQHASALNKHDTTLALYDSRILELVGDLQRLIGRFEVINHIR